MGALEPDEMQAVRAHLRTCPRPHPEVAELAAGVQILAGSLDPIEPAAEVRGRIIAAVEAEARIAGATSDRPPDRGRARLPGSAVGLASRIQHGWLRLAAAGAGVAVVVLLASSAHLAGQLAETQAYADQLRQAAILAAQPGARTLAIAPVPAAGAPAASGIAVLPTSGRGVLVVAGLPPTRGDEVYEIWLIHGSTAPQPAGSFQVRSSGQGWHDAIAVPPDGALSVALTREPGPGATSPSSPIVAQGSSGS
jgi:hypothetical protein